MKSDYVSDDGSHINIRWLHHRIAIKTVDELSMKEWDGRKKDHVTIRLQAAKWPLQIWETRALQKWASRFIGSKKLASAPYNRVSTGLLVINDSWAGWGPWGKRVYDRRRNSSSRVTRLHHDVWWSSQAVCSDGVMQTLECYLETGWCRRHRVFTKTRLLKSLANSSDIWLYPDAETGCKGFIKR